MILDTHVHSKEFSYDSPLPIREAILRGKSAGLDGLCVTDHEHMGMRRLADRLTRKYDFLVLVGMEFLTFEGDLLVFGLDKVPDRPMHAWELTSLVDAQGGCAVSAHPFRDNGRGLGDAIRGLRGLHGLEAVNGSTREHHNAMASDLAPGRERRASSGTSRTLRDALPDPRAQRNRPDPGGALRFGRTACP